MNLTNAITIARDVSISIGCAAILALGIKIEMRLHWTRKATTIAQLFTLGWGMLKIVPWSPLYPTIIAAVVTLWFSWEYNLNCQLQITN